MKEEWLLVSSFWLSATRGPSEVIKSKLETRDQKLET